MATFGALITAATEAVGDNKIDGKKAKDLIDGGDCIVLNVQDGDSKIPGAYNATLGTLPFKACSGTGDFQDKMLTGNKTSKKFIVTCALGGQALLGAKLLIDYGYPNVYVVSGGDKGWEDAGCPLVK